MGECPTSLLSIFVYSVELFHLLIHVKQKLSQKELLPHASHWSSYFLVPHEQLKKRNSKKRIRISIPFSLKPQELDLLIHKSKTQISKLHTSVRKFKLAYNDYLFCLKDSFGLRGMSYCGRKDCVFGLSYLELEILCKSTLLHVSEKWIHVFPLSFPLTFIKSAATIWLLK